MKLRELKNTQLRQSLTSSNRASAHVHPTSRYSPASGQKSHREQPPRSNGRWQNPEKCYNCGSTSRLANQYPHWDKSGPVEAPGREHSQTGGSQVAHIPRDLATVTPVETPKETTAELRQKLKEAEVREAISNVFVTLHGLETGTNSEGVKLGLTPRATDYPRGRGYNSVARYWITSYHCISRTFVTNSCLYPSTRNHTRTVASHGGR